MGLRRALIPYHFGLRWDIIPARAGEWAIVDAPRLSDRIKRVSSLRPDIVVSGDCMVAIGAHRDGLDLVWLDAHGDFNTLETTETGNIGGMPLAMLCGLGDLSLVRVSAPTEVYHLGGSLFDRGEMERMLNHGVVVLPAIHCTSAPIHLHIDTDVIRSADLPSSIHPAPNGVPLEEFYRVLDSMLPTTRVLSIKTYDPRLDVSGVGQKIVLEIIRRFEHEREVNQGTCGI